VRHSWQDDDLNRRYSDQIWAPVCSEQKSKSHVPVFALSRMNKIVAMPSSFSIQALPRTSHGDENVEYALRLKKLRLKTLQEDPGSWVSLYKDEVDQPQDFWVSRLNDPRAIHLVIVRLDSSKDNVEASTTVLSQGDWVGLVVIILPEFTPEDNVDQKEQTSSEFLMAAVSVHSEYRGHGLGGRLVQKAIETSRAFATGRNMTSPCLIARVRPGNDLALKLYQKLGFRIIQPEDHGEKGGIPYTTTVVRVNL
jgi:ribosomal protein S18 acetylase RimI-like enzyme